MCSLFIEKLKKIISILILTIGAVGILFAQKQLPQNLPRLDRQKIHFGYSLGLNSMDFTIRPSDEFVSSFDTVQSVNVRRLIGFNINMIANIRLTEFLNLRFTPGMIFGQRNLDYKYVEDGNYHRHSMMIESTFLDFPLSLKYKAHRINNFRPFILGGVAVRYDLAAQKKIKVDEYPKIRLRPFDVYYEVGVGLDFFLEYFMFGIEIKSSWGTFNIVEYDASEYTDYYDRLNSHFVTIGFHFEGGKISNIKKRNK